jgi:hypothetical protein
MPQAAQPKPVPWDLVVADVAIIGLTVGLVILSVSSIRRLIRERLAAKGAGSPA